MTVITVTRFAPSPTGYLHIGHAFSALTAWNTAVNTGGRFILRLEDIDESRCKPEFEAAIYEDLSWLGITWETPVRRQSDHMADYARALEALDKRGLIYPCFCTRGDIRTEIARMGSAPHNTKGPVYPGTCRDLSYDDQKARSEAGRQHAIRLRMKQAVTETGALYWHDQDLGRIPTNPMHHGDVVLARKDIPTSYHLAVTIDDALQGVTLVTRGQDLLNFTDIHRLLQALLGLETPLYQHHKLLTDQNGRRYSKRDHSLTIRTLRETGLTPKEVGKLAGF